MLPTLTLAAALLVVPMPTIGLAAIQPTVTCSILTNEGHCPVDGQFCRAADLGKSTTNADGREMSCVQDGARGHWEYS
jgi:hypothetical protein